MRVKRLIKDESKCIGCGKCEEACSQAYFKENNPEKSRVRVEGMGEWNKLTICTQCGACMEVCPTLALQRDKNGVVKLNKKDCVGCFMCVGFCPEDAMMQHDDEREPFKCVACGICVDACPTGALSIREF